MNSPYTKHLDASLEPHTTVSVPQYHQAPMMQQPMQPMIVQGGSNDGGGKLAMAVVAFIFAVVAAGAGYAIGQGNGPSWNELRRYEALAGREGEIRGRDSGWNQGRKQGRTEMEFLAKYEQLRTQATAFNQGWKQGLGTGRTMGAAQARGRYGYGYGGYGRSYGRGYGRGYGSYYGGGTRGAVANAQALANATGSPVDVIVG